MSHHHRSPALWRRPRRRAPSAPPLAHGDVSSPTASWTLRRSARGAAGRAAGERSRDRAQRARARVGAVRGVARGATVVPLSARLRELRARRVFADAQPSAAISLAAHGGFSLAEAARGGAWASDPDAERGGSFSTSSVRSARSSRAGGRGHPRRWRRTWRRSCTPPGTTGEPKGALMSHALGVAEGPTSPSCWARTRRRACALVVPASHVFGLACLLCCMAAGGETVLVDSTTSLEPLVGRCAGTRLACCTARRLCSHGC